MIIMLMTANSNNKQINDAAYVDDVTGDDE